MHYIRLLQNVCIPHVLYELQPTNSYVTKYDDGDDDVSGGVNLLVESR